MTMLLFRSFAVISLTALSSPAARGEAGAPDALILRVIGNVDRGTFQLDITDHLEKFSLHMPAKTARHGLESPGFLPVRVVKIDCISGCFKDIHFTEDVDDVPLGAFRLWDGMDQFVTIWGGATAYWVRIYRVGQTGVEKVLEEATKSAPQFGFAADGSPVVILNDPASGKTSVFATHGEIWKRDGDRYQAASGLVEGR